MKLFLLNREEVRNFSVQDRRFSYTWWLRSQEETIHGRKCVNAVTKSGKTSRIPGNLVLVEKALRPAIRIRPGANVELDDFGRLVLGKWKGRPVSWIPGEDRFFLAESFFGRHVFGEYPARVHGYEDSNACIRLRVIDGMMFLPEERGLLMDAPEGLEVLKGFILIKQSWFLNYLKDLQIPGDDVQECMELFTDKEKEIIFADAKEAGAVV